MLKAKRDFKYFFFYRYSSESVVTTNVAAANPNGNAQLLRHRYPSRMRLRVVPLLSAKRSAGKCSTGPRCFTPNTEAATWTRENAPRSSHLAKWRGSPERQRQMGEVSVTLHGWHRVLNSPLFCYARSPVSVPFASRFRGANSEPCTSSHTCRETGVHSHVRHVTVN